jgi:hypothetical protein
VANGNIELTIPIYYLPNALTPFIAQQQELFEVVHSDFSPPHYDQVAAFATKLLQDPTFLPLIQSKFPFVSNIQPIWVQAIPGFAITLDIPPNTPSAPVIEGTGYTNSNGTNIFGLRNTSVRSLVDLFDKIFYQPQDSAWAGIIGTYFVIPSSNGAPPGTTFLTINGISYSEITWEELPGGGILGSGKGGNG